MQPREQKLQVSAVIDSGAAGAESCPGAEAAEAASQSCGQAPPNDEQLQELSQVSRRRKGSTHWEAYAKLLDEKRAASTGLLGLFPVGLAVGETVILLPPPLYL